MKPFDTNRNTGGSPPVFASDAQHGNVITLEPEWTVRAGTRLMGLLGADIRHADLAFAFNNRLLSQWGSDFVYLPFSVKDGDLKDAVRGLRALDVLSANVTFPYKIEIMQYLDRIDDGTRLMGSVNLVVNRGGELWGYNTDSEGFMFALHESGLMPRGATTGGLDSALIYGCGGAGRALAAALAKAGMRTIWLYDIVEEKCQAVEMAHNRNGNRVTAMSPDRLAGVRPALIVNATPAGRGELADVSPVSDQVLGRGIADRARLFFDLNYNPARSRFLQQAEALGIAMENGLRMMCYQAKRSIERAAGREIPWDCYEDAIEAEDLNRYLVSAECEGSAPEQGWARG